MSISPSRSHWQANGRNHGPESKDCATGSHHADNAHQSVEAGQRGLPSHVTWQCGCVQLFDDAPVQRISADGQLESTAAGHEQQCQREIDDGPVPTATAEHVHASNGPATAAATVFVHIGSECPILYPSDEC